MEVLFLLSVLFAVVYGEDGSLCYDTFTVNSMCVAGTELAEKFSAPDVAACSDDNEVSARSSKFQMRAKKEKCPADCVSVDDHFTALMTNMSGDACVLQALGWMDSEGAMIEDEWLPDMNLLPVADMVNRRTMKDCVKEMKADEDFKALRKTCGKCYSNKEEKAMDALEFEFKCFVKLLDDSCAEYVDQQIMGSFSFNPEAYIWTDEGIVPSRLSQVPDSPLTATWPSGAVAGINSVLSSDDMFERPVISFNADVDALYTIMIVDEGIDENGGIQYFHWMKVNVPGSDLTGGEENLEYIAPFYFKENEDATALIDSGDDRGHDILVLAYKQEDTINVEETQSGCQADILSESRVTDKAILVEKYGLEGPVAGTFLWTKWADGGAYWLCYFTKCAGFPFPGFIAPGVNDLPECQSS